MVFINLIDEDEFITNIELSQNISIEQDIRIDESGWVELELRFFELEVSLGGQENLNSEIYAAMLARELMFFILDMYA